MFMANATGRGAVGKDNDSPFNALVEGEWDLAFHRMAMNYTGVNTYAGGSGGNSLGDMWKRAIGLKVILFSEITAGLMSAIMDGL
jgi:hypothetical protein